MDYPLKWKLNDVEEALAFFYRLEEIGDSSLFSRDQMKYIQLAIEALEEFEDILIELQNKEKK
jgi:hypothetical protein